MSDEKPPMPPQPTTKQLPAMTDRALLEDLRSLVKDGFARQEANHDLLAVEVKRAQSDIRGLSAKVGSLEDWRQQVTGAVIPRLDTHSIKVQRISDHDLEQDGKLADTMVWRSHVDNRFTSQDSRLDAIEKKTDFQTGILVRGEAAAKKIWKSRPVQAVAAALFLWLLHWLESKGIKVTP